MEIAAYSTVAVTLGLVVARPRIGRQLRVSPEMAAVAGVLVMMLLGAVGLEHLRRAATELWSPFVAIAAIMVLTEVALRVGLLELWSSWVEARSRSPQQLFKFVFILGVVTSAALNNDAAILLLTPLVIALVHRRYPGRPGIVVPFAFAVFASAGVAALPVSNPMNMVVAEYSGIEINTYAMHMVPVAIACWLLGYWILRRIFARELAEVPPLTSQPEPERATRAQQLMMVLLATALLAYPVVGLFGGPAWAVPLVGAGLALILAWVRADQRPDSVIIGGISWGILVFLLAVLVLSMGLERVGLVDRLAALYEGRGVGVVGVTSAIGSAFLNNHPMSQLNMLALESAGSGDVGVLAALVGGDLGPRLLPIGSLAGLLWFELLRRRGVEINLRQFCTIGLALTIPTLSAALLILTLY